MPKTCCKNVVISRCILLLLWFLFLLLLVVVIVAVVLAVVVVVVILVVVSWKDLAEKRFRFSQGLSLVLFFCFRIFLFLYCCNVST